MVVAQVRLCVAVTLLGEVLGGGRFRFLLSLAHVLRMQSREG